MQALARRIADSILDFALPPRCPGCGEVVAEPHSFCLGCWQTVDWLAGPSCERCGLPFPYDQGAGAQCGACLADPPQFGRLRAAVAYGDVARRVALKLKYGGKPGVARTIARYMQRHLPALGDNVLLAPVPLHRWRIWKRGYNQAALIASALAGAGRHDVKLDLVKRVKPTPPLRRMGRRERLRMLSGAFAVEERMRSHLQGRTIVLVDDVYTSGATTNACARALKRAGAAEVNILCWARVVHREDIDNLPGPTTVTGAGAEHAAG
jgi:ComF family protein